MTRTGPTRRPAVLAVSELSFGERARAKPRGVRPMASRPAPVRLPEPGRPAGG
ncbi:hypothetical protein OOK41_18575 [Micromonospora sp. NBC_01655]|uniref:hypothetical protein n=1 Tax=Micromonospora sp. NBC_01655 TaxID=2975983 RepID=UPI002256FEAD|nr:hypothetical protein [Micromonospora sp. NBC_01655]MCX4472287.1 hypothetical protein [Micromonospora sp. NBC_01655]